MIPFFRPWLGTEEQEAVRRPLLSSWLVQGPEVEALESELAAYLGAQHVVVVSSGTAALHLMLLALGIGPGDEVIAPTHSFIATSNAIALVGARVVFADIEPSTLNLDPCSVKAAISGKTRAVMAVHQFGMPCDMQALQQVCAEANIPILEDAACAIGSEMLVGQNWERIGKPHGQAACFSFHPRKLLTTGEGGAVVTSDSELARRVRRLRQHGMESDESGQQVYQEPGYNYRLSDLHAAVGRSQLARLDAQLRYRHELFDVYARAFPGLLQEQPDWARSNRQTVALLAGRETANIAREAALQGIGLGVGIVNSHQTPAYGRRATAGEGADHSQRVSLHCSEKASRQTLLLPLYHDLSPGDQRRVIKFVQEALS